MSLQQIEQPYETLISSGCDSRLALQPWGLNPYGCSPVHRDVIALGSCSASSPSLRGELAARRMLETLREASDLRAASEHHFQCLREAMQACWHLAPETGIAFTPSGTDVELLVLALAMNDSDRPLVNIVVGPSEVGRGTIRSAAYQHHDRVDPAGNPVQPASPLNAIFADRIRVETIDVRHDDGTPQSATEIDLALQQAVVNALEQGSRVLLHAVAHSKTGLFAPRLATLERIQATLADDVVVVVDAAQARLGAAFGTIGYRHLLRRGFLVSVTGSKFFGGPPFSGALLVPPRYQHPTTLPPGLEHYISRNQLPLSWTEARNVLNDDCNVPLLMRWAAAIAEMRAFYALPLRSRGRVASSFAESVRTHLAAEESMELIRPYCMGDSDWIDEYGAPIPTVFSFAVAGGDDRFGEQELRHLHRQLNGSQPNQNAFHIGQPVRIGLDRWVLRVALGAPLVTDVVGNRDRGQTLASRISWMDQCISDLSHHVTQLAQPAASERLM